MSFYIYLLLGFLGGIPAGMGMGGGTVTIPLLVLVGGVEQKIAQSANLFSFFPMSAGALRVHAQNGLLETKGILCSFPRRGRCWRTSFPPRCCAARSASFSSFCLFFSFAALFPAKIS